MVLRGSQCWWCLAFSFYFAAAAVVADASGSDDIGVVGVVDGALKTDPVISTTLAVMPWYYQVISWQFICGLFLMTSPITSYGDTVYTIWKSKSSAGFSLDLSGIMLVSSILRVAFYFGEPYEASLLWQAVIMIAIQLVLLAVALQYRPGKSAHTMADDVDFFRPPIGSFPNIDSNSINNNNRGGSGGTSILDRDPSKTHASPNGPRRKSVSEIIHNLRPAKSVSVLRGVPETFNNSPSSGISPHVLSSRIVPLARKVSRAIRTSSSSNVILTYTPSGYGTRPFNLWQWNDDIVYWQFLFLLSVALFLLHLVLGTWCWTYIQLLGLVGLMIEAVLPVPQILTNIELQSVQGFRLSLMASWLAGDVSKLTYFRYGTENLAPQFVICTVLRLGLDLFVGVQYVFYGMILPFLNSMAPATGINTDISSNEVIELRPMSELHMFPLIPIDPTLPTASQPPPPLADGMDLVYGKTRQRSHSMKQVPESLA